MTPAGYLVELRPTRRALADPRFGPGALELLIASGARALGFGDERRERFTCCAPWSPARGLAAVVTIEFVASGSGLVAGVCGACAASGRVRELVLAALERDLGPATEVRAVHPEARA
jgi:hypothetical protein